VAGDATKKFKLDVSNAKASLAAVLLKSKQLDKQMEDAATNNIKRFKKMAGVWTTQSKQMAAQADFLRSKISTMAPPIPPGRFDRAINKLRVLSDTAIVTGVNVRDIGRAALDTAGDVIQLGLAGEKSLALSASFKQLGGTSEDLDKLREATGALVEDQTLIRMSNMAKGFGISATNMDKFAKVAIGSSKLLGTSVDKNFNDIIVGLSRKSKPILDNLGVAMRSLDVIYKEYAKTIGVVDHKKLTEEQKSAAFEAEFLHGAVKQLSAASLESADSVQKMAVEWANFKEQVAVATAQALDSASTLSRDIAAFASGGKRELEGFAKVAADSLRLAEIAQGRREILELGEVFGNLSTMLADGELTAAEYSASMDIATTQLNDAADKVNKLIDPVAFLKQQQLEAAAATKILTDQQNFWTGSMKLGRKALLDLQFARENRSKLAKDAAKAEKKRLAESSRRSAKAHKAGQKRLEERRKKLKSIFNLVKEDGAAATKILEDFFTGKKGAGFEGRRGGLGRAFGFGKAREKKKEGFEGDTTTSLTERFLPKLEVSNIEKRVKVFGATIRDTFTEMRELAISTATAMGDVLSGTFNNLITGGENFRENMFSIMGELFGQLSTAFLAWAAAESGLLSGNPIAGAVAAVALGVVASAISSFGSRESGGGSSAAAQAPRRQIERDAARDSGPSITVINQGLSMSDEDAKRIGRGLARHMQLGGRLS